MPLRRPRRQPRDHGLVRNALTRFLVGSLVALLLLALGTALIGSNVARAQALREATRRGDLLATSVAAPLVNRAVRAGEPAATRRMVEGLREKLADGSIRHIKLWSADGTVLWSDQSTIVGKRFRMSSEVRELFGTRKVTAEISPLERAENTQERAEGRLLEVYAGARDADGEPLVFEAYLPLDDLRSDERAIVAGVLGVGLGGLLLFQAAVLPMAIRLARRVERHQVERSKMMRHALLAAELERRRIAQELHDGVIQDLAGICFALPTVDGKFTEDDEGQEARHTVRRVTDLVQRDATALRTMLLEIYPPDLDGDGFARAVDDLARSVRERGIAVTVEVEPGLDVPLDVATLGYRVVREGLRNVVKHSEASTVRVRAATEAGHFEVTVTDDGRGVDPERAVDEGHVGLQLLRDTVRDVGGSVELGPGGPPGDGPGDGPGTRLHVSIPCDLATVS